MEILSFDSNIYEGVVRYEKGEAYVEGIIYGAFDGEPVDGDRMTTHRVRKSWVAGDGIGAIDSQGNTFLLVDIDETHPAVLESLHVLLGLAYLRTGNPEDA